MTRVNAIQTAHTTGKVDAYYRSRVDHERRASAIKELRNMVPMTQGPILRRSGTRFVAEVKDSSKATRLIPFEFSEEQTYAIEFGDTYVRWFTNEGVLLDGPSAYEIASPYAEADLHKLKFTQSADILYLVAEGYQPRQLNRAGASSWNFTTIDFIDGPFNPINDTATTLSTSAAGDKGTSVTITASANTFASTDVGRLIRHKRNGQWRSIKITTFTSATSVDGTFQDDNPTGYTSGSTKEWRLGSWSDTLGWPTVVTFYHQRLVFGNSAAHPSKIWASKPGYFTIMSPTDADGTVNDDNAIDYLIASNKVNNITWLSPGKVLAVGTIGAEFVFHAGTATNPEPISPTNVMAHLQTTYGSDKYLPAIRPGGNANFFFSPSKKRIYEYSYDFQLDGYDSPDLTLLAKTITKSGIVDACFADDVLWMAMEDGRLVSMTYLKAQQVVGFSEHYLGGTDVRVKSLCSIKSPDLSHDQVWMIVERTINGQTKQYVEFLEDYFDPDDPDDKDDLFFADCGLTYDGSATTTITGLDHLEGETVSIIADGAYHPDRVVDSGEITLQAEANRVHVGLLSYCEVEYLEREGGGDFGSAMGKKKRADTVSVYFINSMDALVGQTRDFLDQVYFRTTSDTMDKSPPLYTGYKDIEFEGGYEEEMPIIIQSDKPLPLCIGALIVDYNVNGG